MVQTEASTDLKDARRKGLPWHAVVKALRKMEGASGTDEFGRPWVKVAAEQSGYTVNQLRQMDRTMTTIEALAREHSELSMASALTLPFSHLEIIARISKADLAAARRFLSEEEIASRKSFRDLRNFYYNARTKMPARSSPRSVAYRTIHEFSRSSFNVISHRYHLQTLFEDNRAEFNHKLIKWPGGFVYANPDFVAVDIKGRSKVIYAFECLSIYGDVNRDDASKSIIKPSLESTFFTKYFLVMPFWSDASSIAHHLGALNLANVGIVSVMEGSLNVRLYPKGLPCPDRRGMVHDDAYLMGRIRKSAR